jgi:hypothetical protein
MMGITRILLISSLSAVYQLLKSGSWMQETDMPSDFCFSNKISTSVALVSYSYILFVIRSHRPSYLQICNISDFEMWKWEIDAHHIFFSFLQYLPGMDFLPFVFLAYPKSPLKLQSDPTFKNRRAVLQLCSEGEQSKLQHSFN